MTLLILLAAVMHASWNVMVKVGNDAFLNMDLIVGLGGSLGLLFTPFVEFPERASWIWLFGSCVFHLGYYTFLVMAYRHGELSQVYPIARGSAPPLVALSSWLLYAQALPPLQAPGVAPGPSPPCGPRGGRGSRWVSGPWPPTSRSIARTSGRQSGSAC